MKESHNNVKICVLSVFNRQLVRHLFDTEPVNNDAYSLSLVYSGAREHPKTKESIQMLFLQPVTSLPETNI